MEFLQRLNQKKVHRKPDWSAPVGIAPEQPGLGFRRLVIHAVFHAKDVQTVGMLAMETGERAHAVGREKFRFVEHVAKNGAQLFFIGNGK